MAESTPGSVHIAWYATGFRADKFETALAEITAMAPRYGATSFTVYRSRDDRYRFLQVMDFPTKLEWERFWAGPEFIAFRTTCSSWYQVPVLYAWQDIVAVGGLTPSEAALEPVSE
jgi:hypothetical protein